jgi:hypothetical protein
MSLAIDHQAFIDILYQGEGTVGGAMLPAPDGLWGMPPDMLTRATKQGQHWVISRRSGPTI